MDQISKEQYRIQNQPIKLDGTHQQPLTVYWQTQRSVEKEGFGLLYHAGQKAVILSSIITSVSSLFQHSWNKIEWSHSVLSMHHYTISQSTHLIIFISLSDIRTRGITRFLLRLREYISIIELYTYILIALQVHCHQFGMRLNYRKSCNP